jgi:hypothetical protein
MGGLDPMVREQVCAYLAAVVAARGPLHVNIAWNALHYGWDLASCGYTETLLRVDSLPRLTPGSLDGTPTGVIATLPTETPVWVEVVHVEADDLHADADGDLPAARSGAPYDTSIRMRTVIDDTIFGHPLPEQRRALNRLTRRDDLDQFGHLLSREAPASPRLAEEIAGAPIRAYARWLAADPARLGGGPVPPALDTTDPEPTMHALAASLHALLALADTDQRLRVVGEHLTLGSNTQVLAPEDLEDTIRQMLRVRPRAPRYTSAGGALRHLGTERSIQRARYVTALTQLTSALAEAASTAVPDPTTTTRVRLDDPGRGGGIWRAVGAGSDPGDGYDPLVPLGLGYAASLTTPKPSPSPGTDTRDAAGAATHARDGRSAARAGTQTPAPGQQEQVAQRGDGLLGELDVTASHLSFTFALRTRHLTDGTMPLPTALYDAHLRFAPQPLAVRVGHDGAELPDDATFYEPVTVHTDPCQLRGLLWPLEFHPGLLLTATWTVGGRILDITTERLPDPVIYAGIPLTHATDLTILAAHLGEHPPDNATAQAAAGPHAHPTLADAALDGDPPDAPGIGNPEAPAEDECGSGGPTSDLEHGERDLRDPNNRAYLALLLRAVARTVQPGPDGVRSFTAPVLVATTFAGLPAPKDAVGRAERLLDAYAARGRLIRLPGQRRFGITTHGFREAPPSYLWWPPGGRPPTRRSRCTAGPAVRQPHRIPVTLRKLPEGWEPSPAKVATWPQVHASLGPTYLKAQLPPGHTWIEAHERGKDPGWRSGAVRRR